MRHLHKVALAPGARGSADGSRVEVFFAHVPEASRHPIQGNAGVGPDRLTADDLEAGFAGETSVRGLRFAVDQPRVPSSDQLPCQVGIGQIAALKPKIMLSSTLINPPATMNKPFLPRPKPLQQPKSDHQRAHTRRRPSAVTFPT